MTGGRSVLVRPGFSSEVDTDRDPSLPLRQINKLRRRIVPKRETRRRSENRCIGVEGSSVPGPPNFPLFLSTPVRPSGRPT